MCIHNFPPFLHSRYSAAKKHLPAQTGRCFPSLILFSIYGKRFGTLAEDAEAFFSQPLGAVIP